MTAKIQIRRDTTANWGTDPVLNSGEFGLDTTLSQLKVGTGAVWSATPWLTGSLPYFGSPSSSDLNDGTNRVAGRYRFVSATASPTNGPFTFAVDDGIATLLVTAYGDTIAQFLSTEGNGTTSFPSKNYFRLYDGGSAAWRAWMPLSNWATGAAVGTPIECTTVNAKGVVTIADGVVGAPAIAFASDTDTGLYWKAANQLGIAVGGTLSAHFTATQLVTNSISCTTTSVLTGNCSMGGTLGVTGLATFSAGAAMNGFKVTGVADATSLTDGLNLQSLLDRIAIIAPASSVGNIYTASNGASWTLTALNPVTWTATSPSGGNYDGIIIAFDGNGALLPAFCKVFNNDPSPIVASAGAAIYAILIAIKRS
jgi:hypothetical protein